MILENKRNEDDFALFIDLAKLAICPWLLLFWLLLLFRLLLLLLILLATFTTAFMEDRRNPEKPTVSLNIVKFNYLSTITKNQRISRKSSQERQYVVFED